MSTPTTTPAPTTTPSPDQTAGHAPHRTDGTSTIATASSMLGPAASAAQLTAAARADAAQHLLAEFPTYAGAERAVDRLSDDGFPFEYLRIDGTWLRSVEYVTGRLTTTRAAGLGALRRGCCGPRSWSCASVTPRPRTRTPCL